MPISPRTKILSALLIVAIAVSGLLLLEKRSVASCFTAYGKGDTEGTIAECTTAYRLSFLSKESRAKALVYRAAAYSEANRYPEAIEDGKEAVSIAPDIPAFYRYLGGAYLSAGHADETIASFTQAINLDKSDWASFYDRALAYDKKGDYDRAIADYTQAIALQPKEAQIYVNLGIDYVWKENFEAARSALTTAIGMQLSTAEAFYFRGQAFYGLQDFASATKDFSQAISLSSGTVAADYMWRASSHRKAGEFDAALADDKQALALKPNLALALAGYCFDLSVKGNPVDALDSCDNAVQWASNKVVALRYRAYAWLRLERWADALHDLSQARELDPQPLADDNFMRGYLFERVDRTEDADRFYQLARDADPQIDKKMAAIGLISIARKPSD